MVNITKNPSANNIGVSKVNEPLNNVATQLNTFTPVGTATIIVAYIKNNSAANGIPVVNIWCAHTIYEINAIAMVAYTIACRPNKGLRLKVGMISEITPNAGKINT